jgi:signal peptidase I
MISRASLDPWSWRVAVILLLLIGGALIAVGCGGSSSSSQNVVNLHYVSESMRPTLEAGQRIRVKLGGRCCQRGDIVLFRTPGETAAANSNVKRVIGLPGETVSLPGDGRVYINGRVVSEPYLDSATKTMGVPGSVPRGCESPTFGALECAVRESAYFVLGDNRPESKDSRFFGSVDATRIRGVVDE